MFKKNALNFLKMAFKSRLSYFDTFIILILAGVLGSFSVFTIVVIVVLGAVISGLIANKVDEWAESVQDE